MSTRTATTDGNPAVIAPATEDWWETWHKPETWTKETSPLPGDSVPPEQVLADAEKARTSERTKITDGNAQHDAGNRQLCEDDAVAKKLKSRGVKPIPLPNASLSDAEYNKAVTNYNAWIIRAKAVYGTSSKFESLDPLTLSAGVAAWTERGLPKDFYMHRINDDVAAKIAAFRSKNIPQNKQTALNRFLQYEPKKEYRNLGDQITSTKKAIQEQKSKVAAAEQAYNRASHAKKPDDDAIANAKAKYENEKQTLNDLQAHLDELNSQVEKLESSGVICSYNGGVIVAATASVDDWKSKAAALGYDPRLGSTYYALAAGPRPREGTPTTVVSYDATFTYGAGFNASTGPGWQIFRDIATQKGYAADETAALVEMWNYLKKCGIFIYPNNIAQSASMPYPIDVVHIENGSDGKPRGYVVTNDTVVKTGIHPVAGQNHQETHGAAYEAIRHSRLLLQALIAAGLTATVPDQQNMNAAPLNNVLALVNFRIFCNLHKNSVSLKHLIKGDALFVLLTHYMHWGPILAVDNMLLWAISRRLISTTIQTSTGNTTPPLEVKGDNDDKDDEASVEDVTSFTFTPTFETDAQFARLMGPYAMKVLSKASRGQMQGYWKEFLDDFRSLDGQGALADTLPKYFLDTVAEVKARDNVDDATIASDYATENVNGLRVLGKKRDIDQIPRFRTKAGRSAMSTLRSRAEELNP